eukprot:3940799-Rhodomonas_salina.1
MIPTVREVSTRHCIAPRRKVAQTVPSKSSLKTCPPARSWFHRYVSTGHRVASAWADRTIRYVSTGQSVPHGFEDGVGSP